MTTIGTVYDAATLAACHRWTHSEEFPEFTHTVRSVRRVGHERARWVISVGGVEREFDAPLTDQIPDAQGVASHVDDSPHARGNSAKTCDGRGAADAEITTDDI